MTRTIKLFYTVVLLSLLAGCAAMLVPATSDPAEKLKNAASLFGQQQRPIPAEKLILEAIDIYEQQQNKLGLAEAYRQYGFFFRSASVEKSAQYFRNVGFIEKTATFETRYSKSIEYFEKARDIYTEQKKYDALINVYLNMGVHIPTYAKPKSSLLGF